MMKGKITIISAICAIFIGMIPVNAQFKNGASYADDYVFIPQGLVATLNKGYDIA